MSSGSDTGWVDNVEFPELDPDGEVISDSDFTPAEQQIYFDGDSITYSDLYDKLVVVMDTAGMALEVTSDDLTDNKFNGGRFNFNR